MKLKGWRKVIICTEGIVALCLLVIATGIKEGGAIISLGLAITGIIGTAVYGNVQEHKHGAVTVVDAPMVSTAEIGVTDDDESAGFRAH